MRLSDRETEKNNLEKFSSKNGWWFLFQKSAGQLGFVLPQIGYKKSKNLWNHWGFLCWVYLNSSFLSLPHEFHPAGSYLVGMEPSHRKLNFLPFSTSPFRLRSGDIGGYFRSPCQRKHLKEKSRVKMRIDHQPDLSLLVPCFPQNLCHQKWTSCIEDMNFLQPILQTTLHLHPFIISTFTS